MLSNSKVTGRAVSIPVGLSVGVILSIISTIVLAWITAYFVSIEILRLEQIGYFAMSILMAASLLGARVCAGKIKRMPMQMALICGATYMVTLLSVTALFFGGQYQGIGVSALTVLVGSGAGGILASRSKKMNSKKRRKKSYREFIQIVQIMP